MKMMKYDGCGPILERIEKKFGQLLGMARRLLEYRYRFVLLHQLNEFKKTICVMTIGRIMYF